MITLALLGVSLMALLSLPAQQPASAPPPVELSFGRAAGRAGETVKLPLYLKSADNVTTPFRVTLELPRSKLTYRAFEPAYLARYAGWKLSAKLRPHAPNAPRAVLDIAVDPTGAEFFPSGVVAYVELAIAPGVPDGAISIDAALGLPPSVPLTAVSKAATVTVYTELTVTGCFFYMH